MQSIFYLITYSDNIMIYHYITRRKRRSYLITYSDIMIHQYFFLILFIKQKYVTILTIVHLDKCSCIGH